MSRGPRSYSARRAFLVSTHAAPGDLTPNAAGRALLGPSGLCIRKALGLPDSANIFPWDKSRSVAAASRINHSQWRGVRSVAAATGASKLSGTSDGEGSSSVATSENKVPDTEPSRETTPKSTWVPHTVSCLFNERLVEIRIP